jgi:hypothetical protein
MCLGDRRSHRKENKNVSLINRENKYEWNIVIKIAVHVYFMCFMSEFLCLTDLKFIYCIQCYPITYCSVVQ